jgi:AraC-like DNA-binding protein
MLRSKPALPHLKPPEEWTQRVGAFSGLPGLIRELGGDPVAILAQAGLGIDAFDDPDDRVPFAAIGQVLHETARRTRCPHLGLLVGRMWSLTDIGLTGDLIMNSRTVGEGLRSHVLYQQMNSEGALAFLLERSGTVDLGYAVYHPHVKATNLLHDAGTAAIFNCMRSLCGPGWLPTAVLLPHSKPADVTPYRQLFKVTPRFDAEFAAVRFADHWMKRPVDGADPQKLARALERCRDLEPGDLVQGVFRAMRVLLLHGNSSGDDLARMLSMHRRTLNRRLEAHGTTFRQVLDTVRFDVARQLLTDSQISLDDVADTLGYASVSPFMRSFQRWAGTTPARWRRAAASGSHGPSRDQPHDDGAPRGQQDVADCDGR